MQRNKNLWKKDYFTILIGQGFSLISSGILQMSIIFYLTAFGYILLFLSVGDRGPGLHLITIIAVLYNFYIKSVVR